PQPDDRLERTPDDHRRRDRAWVLRNRAWRSARRNGAGDDEGTDDADVGRPREPPQPMAHADGAAEAGRVDAGSRSIDERALSPDQRGGSEAQRRLLADIQTAVPCE